MKTDISVIIVNYNTSELVKDCLISLYSQVKDISFEVFVVDNDSNDDIEDMLQENFPYVNLIKNSKNIGFGAANNIAINKSSGEYIFFLNPDTLLRNNALSYLLNFAKSKLNIGAVGCYLEDEEGAPIHSYGSFLNYFYDLFYSIGYAGKKLLNFKKRSFIRRKFSFEPKSLSVDYITGAALLVPRKVINDIGGFDERFFMYSEETDLQFRMFKNFYSRYVISGPRIVHLEGKSFSLSNSRRIMMSVSKLKYVKKHKGIFPYYIMKFVYLTSASIETIADLYYSEYTVKENINYIRCISHAKYK